MPRLAAVGGRAAGLGIDWGHDSRARRAARRRAAEQRRGHGRALAVPARPRADPVLAVLLAPVRGHPGDRAAGRGSADPQPAHALHQGHGGGARDRGRADGCRVSGVCARRRARLRRRRRAGRGERPRPRPSAVRSCRRARARPPRPRDARHRRRVRGQRADLPDHRHAGRDRSRPARAQPHGRRAGRDREVPVDPLRRRRRRARPAPPRDAPCRRRRRRGEVLGVRPRGGRPRRGTTRAPPAGAVARVLGHGHRRRRRVLDPRRRRLLPGGTAQPGRGGAGVPGLDRGIRRAPRPRRRGARPPLGSCGFGARGAAPQAPPRRRVGRLGRRLRRGRGRGRRGSRRRPPRDPVRRVDRLGAGPLVVHEPLDQPPAGLGGPGAAPTRRAPAS